LSSPCRHACAPTTVHFNGTATVTTPTLMLLLLLLLLLRFLLRRC
jgi:hypothetical protein